MDNVKDTTGKSSVRRYKFLLACALCLAAALLAAILVRRPAFLHRSKTDISTCTQLARPQATSEPAVVATCGYLNRTPLTAHTTARFDSSGTSTLVAFVSSHPLWEGRPVTISGITDDMGNTWKPLTGPTPWTGSIFTLLSAIYYVNAPVTGAKHTITVHLTNPASLVVHVFAVSGSDVTAVPIYSVITHPSSSQTSADVTSDPIAVPNNTLLLGWAKNESESTATAVDGYTRDPRSTNFLWAEYRTAPAAGSYSGHFQYDKPIGWETAIVGLKPTAAPTTANQAAR